METIINKTNHYGVCYGQPEKQRRPHVIEHMIHRHNRRNIENKVWLLEKKFRNTRKIENPERWFVLQAELGEAYRELMRLQVGTQKQCKNVRQSSI